MDHLTNVIQSFYAGNIAPTLQMVYKKFMEDVKQEEDGRVSNGENIVQFKCSKWSLRKIIRQLGFRFKRINNRSVILLRVDIAAKRWDYLEIMKRNRESDNPKCVIFTDETWIDPHARTGKGWVISKPKTFEEAAKYSYKNPKVSRGPRVIIMHAGGSGGFVPNVMKIYPVSKSKVTEDYHQNVDGDSYMRWWRNLNEQVQENYGSCIIVIDNAPYHSTLNAPKSSSKKQDMYDWLEDNIPLSRRSELKPIGDMRRPELWNLVQGLKSVNNYYEVDQEALKYGNIVVRLPPYNCDLNPIEYVWKDIKHAVRCANFLATSEFAQREAERIMASYSPEQ
ncbi:uncharacterized protein LOC118439048 [Folsomia candida]|uniref:uncharacterized protein LOC118439048 n=1 Tax=Folsomia candida TaxID=158441 RepID=UPI001604CD05|nr:uncharacterized protein LOC118439048 [Folsomia candida]